MFCNLQNIRKGALSRADRFSWYHNSAAFKICQCILSIMWIFFIDFPRIDFNDSISLHFSLRRHFVPAVLLIDTLNFYSGKVSVWMTGRKPRRQSKSGAQEYAIWKAPTATSEAGPGLARKRKIPANPQEIFWNSLEGCAGKDIPKIIFYIILDVGLSNILDRLILSRISSMLLSIIYQFFLLKVRFQILYFGYIDGCDRSSC